MHKICLLAFIALMPLLGFTQENNLTVKWDEYHESHVPTTSVQVIIKIVQDGNVLEEINGTNDLEHRTTLAPGEYEIHVFRDGKPDFTVYQIIIKEGKKLTVDIDRPVERYATIDTTKSSDDDNVGMTMYLSFASSRLEGSKEPVPFQLGIGSDMHFMATYLNRFRIGITTGFNVSLSRVNRGNDSTLVTLTDSKRERYLYASYYMGLMHRVIFTPKRDLPFYLDFGADYHLPLWFRHASISKNQMLVGKRIHAWNDVRAYARVGFLGGLSLAFRYRIFDFAQSPYPQLPKYEICLGVTFN